MMWQQWMWEIKNTWMWIIDERFVLRALIQIVIFQHILKYSSLTYKTLRHQHFESESCILLGATMCYLFKEILIFFLFQF